MYTINKTKHKQKIKSSIMWIKIRLETCFNLVTMGHFDLYFSKIILEMCKANINCKIDTHYTQKVHIKP